MYYTLESTEAPFRITVLYLFMSCIVGRTQCLGLLLVLYISFSCKVINWLLLFSNRIVIVIRNTENDIWTSISFIQVDQNSYIINQLDEQFPHLVAREKKYSSGPIAEQISCTNLNCHGFISRLAMELRSPWSWFVCMKECRLVGIEVKFLKNF